MLSIDDYIEYAQAFNGNLNDAQLSRELNLSQSQVGFYKKRKSLPSDETMVRLAEMGNQNIDLALLHLNWWRAVSRDEYMAASHYKYMIESFEKQAA